MKLLLLYPPVTAYKSTQIKSHPPIGLMYLAAYAKKLGHDVKFVDLLAEGRDIVKKVRMEDCGWV